MGHLEMGWAAIHTHTHLHEFNIHKRICVDNRAFHRWYLPYTPTIWSVSELRW